MQYYNFSALFGHKNPNMLYTKADVRIGNFTMHKGAEINRGISIDGIDLFSLEGKILQVQVSGNTYWIRGVQNG
jgi:hypothetical protein